MEEIFLLNSGAAIRIKRRLLRIADLRDEVDLDQPDPELILSELKTQRHCGADVFTFCQRLPEVIPKYRFYQEWDSIAVLDYQSHQYWQEKILDDKTRNMVRKAGKKGVEVRVVDFDDDLVRGIVEIYNESPVRQGRSFKHYGKSFSEVKAANATHLERSIFIGAIYGYTLIGFIKLVYGDRTARAEQIISRIEHRDKAPMNALIDKAVMLCEERNLPYLVYGIWPHMESFAQFKKNSGFKRVDLPRYYIPLNAWGRMGLKLNFHKELKHFVPDGLKPKLREVRATWHRHWTGIF